MTPGMELFGVQLGVRLVLSRSGALTYVNEQQAWFEKAMGYDKLRALRRGAGLCLGHRTCLRPRFLEPGTGR